MITFVFSMLGPTLTEGQASAFRAYAEWRVAVLATAAALTAPQLATLLAWAEEGRV